MDFLHGLKHEEPLSLEAFFLDELTRDLGFESDEDALLEDLPSERDPQPHRARPRIDHYYEEAIPAMTDEEFRTNFRVNRVTMETIVDILGEREGHVSGQGAMPSPRQKQVLLTLFYLGSSLSFRKVAEQFEMCMSSSYMFVDEVIEKLAEMCSIFIRLPVGQQMLTTLRDFEEACGVKGVLGAISDQHVTVKKPNHDPPSFCNRRGYHSIHLLSVADAQGRFTAVDVGWPGSMTEAQVLEKSQLAEQLMSEEVRHTFMPSECFLAGSHLLPLKPWLMTPFPASRLGANDHRRQYFNQQLASAAELNQRAVGVMKARFQRLAFIDTKTMKKAVLLITATCVLHNMCIALGDRWGEEVVEEDQTDEHEEPIVGIPITADAYRRRNRLVNEMWHDWAQGENGVRYAYVHES